MQRIPNSAVRRWTTVGPERAPLSLSTHCPHCGCKGNFTLGSHHDDKRRLAIAADARCPGCDQSVHFWAIRASAKDKHPTVFMYPPASVFPLPDLSESEVPVAVQESLIATIDAFNANIYSAAAVCAGRTLEGIFKHLVGAEHSGASLASLIDHATQKVDLAAPLRLLSHAIRDGRNIGAHFDEHQEVSPELAHQMVQLLDYLISYLFVLPREIKKIDTYLSTATSTSVKAKNAPPPSEGEQ